MSTENIDENLKNNENIIPNINELEITNSNDRNTFEQNVYILH